MSRAFFHAFAGHLLLALAAFLMIVQTSVIFPLLHISVVFKITVFISTFVIYRLAYYGLKWPFNIPYLIRRKEIALCLLALFILLPLLRPFEIAGLIIMMPCCLVYFVEIGKWKGFRSFPFIKSLWLALVWTISTVLIPLFENLDSNTWLLFLEKFLFILSLCIIYNLQDSKTDIMNGIRTIPHKIGATATKQFSLLMLGLSAVTVFIQHYQCSIGLAISISLVVSAFIILKAKEGGRQLYYSLAVDASMILQSLLVIASVAV